MKLNKIFMALAAVAMVGCSSEDVSDFSANQAIDDSGLIELSPDFILAGVGEGDAVTRTHWEKDAETGALVNKFLPIYAENAGGRILGEVADLTAQAVGLCWLGNGAATAEVYTNYQFYHFGWLNNDEPKADYACGTLYNGSLYSEIGNTMVDGVTSTLAGGFATEEADPANDFTIAAIPGKSQKAGEDNLNYNSGVYKTDNKAIFGGDYIVYYPFNPDFQEIGTIPATAPTSFAWNIATDTYESPKLGHATFRYSNKVHIDGGNQAADFGLQNLSTLVRLRVSTVAGDVNIGKSIDKIVLYSESGKLYKQANLAADQIVAGKKGADLYASTEATKTVSVNFTGTAPLLNVKATTEVSAFITVLPTTVDDLVALVHNSTDGKWARVNLAETEFKAGSGKVLDITIKDADFTSDFVAVDFASLKTALLEAEAAVGTDEPQTITVIGDITLTDNLNIEEANDRFITIDGGDIIVPELRTLTLTTLKEMKSTVRVLGTECCSGAGIGGRLVVTGVNAEKDATILNNIILEPTEARTTTDTYDALSPMVTYQGDAKITIAEGATVNVKGGNVVVSRDVQHRGNLVVAASPKEGVQPAKVTVNGTKGNLNFLGSTVVNNGTIEVMKAGSFNLKKSDGGSTWAVGQNMTNNGTFIHNVDAVVGTACQNMQGAGEYRCRVDKQKALDDAYVQWTRCSVIEMVDGAVTYDLVNAQQHTINGTAKYIDVEVNNTAGIVTFDNASKDTKEIKIGNLTVVKGSKGLTVNMVNGDKKRKLTVNGNMKVSENASLTAAQKVTVTGNLDIDNLSTLTYAGANAIVDGLAVTGNITVTDANFNAGADNGIKISCTNFSLIKETNAATATFGNRTKGSTDLTMAVNGTINNGKGCTFTISPAAGGNLLAWITCYETTGEGTWDGDPTVIAKP